MKAIFPVIIKTILPVVILFAMTHDADSQRTTAVTRGTWGGAGIVMEVGRTDVNLHFDCAEGTITKQLRMTKNGSFEAAGNYTPNSPGPMRIDRQPQARSVVYKGKVSGKKMSLSIRDAKTGDEIVAYTTTRGQSGRLHRCL